MTDKLEAGDLITSYYKGYFRVTSIEERWFNEKTHKYTTKTAPDLKYCPLVYFNQIMDASFKPRKSKSVMCCDGLFCAKITPEHIAGLRAKFKEEYEEKVRGLDKLVILLGI